LDPSAAAAATTTTQILDAVTVSIHDNMIAVLDVKRKRTIAMMLDLRRKRTTVSTLPMEKQGKGKSAAKTNTETSTTADSPESESKDHQLGRSCNFPNKLYQLLEYSHNPNHDHQEIISWDSDGTSFAIRNVEEFMKSLSPKFFPNQSCFRSFERMLNLWGFARRRPAAPRSSKFPKSTRYCYKHPHFVREQPSWIKRIKRELRNKSSVRLKGGMIVNQNIPPWAQTQQQAALQFLNKNCPAASLSDASTSTGSAPRRKYSRLHRPPTPYESSAPAPSTPCPLLRHGGPGGTSASTTRQEVLRLGNGATPKHSRLEEDLGSLLQRTQTRRFPFFFVPGQFEDAPRLPAQAHRGADSDDDSGDESVLVI
jgi:hypothetical protein